MVIYGLEASAVLSPKGSYYCDLKEKSKNIVDITVNLFIFATEYTGFRP